MGLGTTSALDSIVHDRLHSSLSRFYPSLTEIQAATSTQRPNGELVKTWETAWVLYGNLAQRTATEIRGGTMTRIPVGTALNLHGHYPGITVAHRAVIDYQTYNITAVVHDSLSGSTRLELEQVAY